jgi:hypothetical protein
MKFEAILWATVIVMTAYLESGRYLDKGSSRYQQTPKDSEWLPLEGGSHD